MNTLGSSESGRQQKSLPWSALCLPKTQGEVCVLVPYEKCMVPTYHEWMQEGAARIKRRL